jgi:hypothetical protein
VATGFASLNDWKSQCKFNLKRGRNNEDIGNSKRKTPSNDDHRPRASIKIRKAFEQERGQSLCAQPRGDNQANAPVARAVPRSRSKAHLP